jgi:SAM-dependent methyltransferase
MGSRMIATAVIWHDLECGGYTADLPLWRELAARHGASGILDVGAGTGRVALDLARQGHVVLALERDPMLAEELARRADDLAISVICADACDFAIDEAVGLCIAPMQTVQLLADRAAFLRCARAALRPGGVLALAVLGAGVTAFDVELDADVLELAGVRYASTPTALRTTAQEVVLERSRSVISDGNETVSIDVTRLAQLDAQTLEREAALAALRSRGSLTVAPTAEHAGSQVLLYDALSA